MELVIVGMLLAEFGLHHKDASAGGGHQPLHVGFLLYYGPGFLSRALEEFLRIRAMKHVVSSPYHPQTNGKLERYHRTAKARVNLLIYNNPEALIQAMESFALYYNYQRYHEALGNVTPADVYYGRRNATLDRREEVKQHTLTAPRVANLSPS